MSEPSWPPPPIPVQALPYSNVPSRPGVITAIGVISIVLASISVLASAYLGLMCVLFWSMSKMSTAMATATTTTSSTVISPSGSSGITTVTISPTNTASPSVSPTPSATPPPTNVVEMQPSKLSAADHATILKAFTRLEPLSAARRKQLDLLIGAAGDRMVPTESGDALTVDQVLASVSEHGQMPSADATIAGAHFFATGSGRMEIYDDHCVFYPGDGSDTVRFGSGSSVAGGTADPNSNASAVADPTKLTPGELQGILNQAQSASQNKLTQKHLASLTSVLQAPNQPYATPGAKVPAVISAFVDRRGNASIYFYNGTVTIDGTGKVVNQFTASSSAGGFSGPVFSANRTACVLSVVGAVLGVALAVFLLVAGILMLKQSPRGRTLHLIYAGLKIPAAIGSAIAVMWMFGSFANSAAAAAAAATPSAGPSSGIKNTGPFVFMSAILIVISCAYPIALLIVMNLRSTKQYYAPTPAA